MTSTPLPARRWPAGRGFVLLVLAVLAGVLAMHGLGPGGTPVAAGIHPEHGRTAPVVAHEVADTRHASTGCSHSAGGSGHVQHADATCAAASVASPYTPPNPAVTLGTMAALAGVPGGVSAVTETGRAPPDLAELQLLRI